MPNWDVTQRFDGNIQNSLGEANSGINEISLGRDVSLDHGGCGAD